MIEMRFLIEKLFTDGKNSIIHYLLHSESKRLIKIIR